MLRLKAKQRAVLVAILPELANLGVAGLVFGQGIGDRAFSWSLVALAGALWLLFVSIAIYLAGVKS